MPLGGAAPAPAAAGAGTKRWNSSPTGRQAGLGDGAEAAAAQARRLGHLRPAGGAAAQVGGEVKALHRRDYPARVAALPAQARGCRSRPVKWPAHLRTELPQMAAIDSPDTPIAAPEAPAVAKPVLMANAIRALAMDAVQQANSGHPGRADGHGRDRGRAVGPAPAPQPGQSALARPRPLRAVERPRLDAAVRAAAPDRLRPARSASCATSASCTARRRAIRRSASRRASRRPPARSARASPTPSAWRSPRSCSPPSSTGDGSRRSSTTTPTSSSATAA